jgi:sulfhydrogenase subunit delta
VGDFCRTVYSRPEFIQTLAKSTPISQHVKVDYELRGCPINKDQLLEVLSAFLNGRKPVAPTHAVCVDCKLNGTVCVMVAKGLPCMGPLTQTGCGALCPAYGRACYGCFGPKETPNTASWSQWEEAQGASQEDLVRAFRTFNAYAPAFREESEKHEKAPK